MLFILFITEPSYYKHGSAGGQKETPRAGLRENSV